MTQDEIEHMWKVASNNPNHDTNWHDPVVIAFAALVEEQATAKEREACAKKCEEIGNDWKTYGDEMKTYAAEYLANAIRARVQA